MTKREVLEFLKAELAFLEFGGYEQHENEHAAWRAVLVFEDSPNCLNFSRPFPRVPCGECPLIQFVPENLKQKEAPCRFIPMDNEGQTLDSLYRSATKEETLAVVRRWLKEQIADLEGQIRMEAA